MSATALERDAAVGNGSDQSSDEEFVEASSSFPPRAPHDPGPPRAPHDPGVPVDVESGLAAIQAAIDMMNNNQFAETEAMLQPLADSSMYHCLALGTVFFLQAVMSLEQEDIERAISTLNKGVRLCNRQRKNKGVIESITNWVFGTKMENYTLAELQAEIMHSEGNLLLSMLTFLQDESLMSFIKGGLRIRSCHSSYKNLYSWLQTCEQEGTELEPNFACGVRMGIGTFNLFLSLLPSRILRLLEFIGFSGNRQRGLSELLKATQTNSFRAPLCSIFLLFFHTVITKILGIEGESVDHCEDLLRPQFERYPNSVQFLFIKGRIQLMRGDVDEAMVWYIRALEIQDHWKQVHHLCWWEIMWCHCFKGEWEVAASYADKLYKHSKWSKATFLYQKAAFLLMGQRNGHHHSHTSTGEASPADTAPDIAEMMKAVAPLKQRIAGKSIPVEKFSISKSERYLQGERLPIPGMEMMYVWNEFSLLANNETVLRAMLQRASEELAVVEEFKDSNPSYVDNWVITTLIQGVLLKELHRYGEARQCFQGILSRKHQVQRDHYALAAASLELGMVYLETGNRAEAKRVLENTKTAFKGYHLESRIHFRIHAGQCKLKAESE